MMLFLKKIIKRIRQLLVLSWCLFVFLIGWSLAFNNPSRLTVDLFGIQLPEWSLGRYLVFTFAAGVLVGLLFVAASSQVKQVTKQNELRRTRKEMRKLQASLPDNP